MIMKKAAIISDIHSNYYAFSACLDDARRRGADAFVFLGDYVTDFPDARKTLDLLYGIKEEYPCHIIRGNRERYMLECRSGEIKVQRGTRTGSWLYNFSQLTDADLDYFASLPISGEIELFGVGFEISHSGMENDRVFFEKGDSVIPAVFDGMKKKYLLTGHSHRQYIAESNGKTIINPGSVGLPRGSACKAQYALLSVDGDRVDCEPLQVEYDILAAVHRHFESGFVDCANVWALAAVHDAITGVEYTARLLNRANKLTNGNALSTDDESLWESVARSLGMKFSEAELAELVQEYK